MFFIQMEAQFANGGISRDISMYNHVIASLDPKYLATVSDLVRDPPDANKYITLKTRLINEFTASDQKKLRVLLTEIELGDDKPSQLLRNMRELAKNSMSDDALRSLWIDRLPESVRAVVAISNDNLNTCATLADKIVELTAPKQTCEVRTVTGNEQAHNSLDSLTEKIEALTKKFERFQSGKGRNFSKKSNGTRSRSKSSGRRPYCRFHFKFGAMAKKCEQPCIFKNPQTHSEN